MTTTTGLRSALAFGGMAVVLASSSSSLAQDASPPPTAAPPAAGPSPSPPPYGYPPQPYGPYPPPYGYPYPPPGYYGQPAYGPPAYGAPVQQPWREGDPVPRGYRVEQRPRSGLVTAGYIVTAVPYALGILAAGTANFRNESVWLVVPFAGPFMTLGRRSYPCRVGDSSQSALVCVGETFGIMGLIADGIVQLGGGTLLLIGYTATRAELVPGDVAVRVAPMNVGNGYGMGMLGAF